MKSYKYFLFAQVLLVVNFLIGIFASTQSNSTPGDVASSTETPAAPIWGGICELGSMQSPIRLERSFSLPWHNRDPPLRIINFDNKRLKYVIKNNGNGVEMLTASELKVTISSGNLPSEYVLEKVQWHWDQSEHKLNNRTFILETHLLFRNKRYFSWDIALSRDDGVVILAVLHQPVQSASNYLGKIRLVLDQVVEPQSTSQILKDITIQEILPKYTGTYYTYKGSLTSPPCSEGVTWIVFADYHEAMDKDIAQFQQVKGKDGRSVMKNYRAIQTSYDRFVAHVVQKRHLPNLSPQKIGPSFMLIILFIYLINQ